MGPLTKNGSKASNVTIHGEIVVPKFLAKNGPINIKNKLILYFCVYKLKILKLRKSHLTEHIPKLK
jgi:hypothetical protein